MESVRMYKITADYRKENQNRPAYYVLARSPREAKARFANWISWLKIYGCEELDNETARNIMAEPMKHAILD